MSAYRDYVAWSRYDAATDSYRLMSFVQGGIVPLPVRPRRAPFDVDLGPGRDGRTIAVYSRCRRDPRENQPTDGPIGYQNGRGCDIYSFDFATRRERMIRGVSGASTSEYLPTTWKGSIAFARIYERRRGLAGVIPHLMARRARASRTWELPAGPRGEYTEAGFRRPFHGFGGPGPRSLDLRGGRLAYVWAYRPHAPCPTREPAWDYDIASQVRVGSLSSGSAVVDGSCTNGWPGLFSTSFDLRGRVVYAYNSDGPEVFESLRRFDPRTGGRAAAPTDWTTVAVAAGGPSPVLLRIASSREESAYEVVRMDPVAYIAKSRRMLTGGRVAR